MFLFAGLVLLFFNFLPCTRKRARVFPLDSVLIVVDIVAQQLELSLTTTSRFLCLLQFSFFSFFFFHLKNRSAKRKLVNNHANCRCVPQTSIIFFNRCVFSSVILHTCTPFYILNILATWVASLKKKKKEEGANFEELGESTENCQHPFSFPFIVDLRDHLSPINSASAVHRDMKSAQLFLFVPNSKLSECGLFFCFLVFAPHSFPFGRCSLLFFFETVLFFFLLVFVGALRVPLPQLYTSTALLCNGNRLHADISIWIMVISYNFHWASVVWSRTFLPTSIQLLSPDPRVNEESKKNTKEEVHFFFSHLRGTLYKEALVPLFFFFLANSKWCLTSLLKMNYTHAVFPLLLFFYLSSLFIFYFTCFVFFLAILRLCSLHSFFL